MTKKKFLSFLFATIFLLGGCNFDDTYYAPCEGKYSSQKVIDSIESTLHLKNNVYFNNYYKNPVTIPTNCDTIRMQITGDNISDIVDADTFVQTISKIFFNDTANAAIKYLKLHVENFIPEVGKIDAKYLLDRNSSINNNSLNIPVDTNTIYNIVEVTPHTSIFSDRKEEGMQVDVNLQAEPKDVASLAAEIKQKYNNEIHENSLDEFSVYFTIEKPNNKYCISKSYSVFYHKRNKNL
jgi:hypothetical protein